MLQVNLSPKLQEQFAASPIFISFENKMHLYNLLVIFYCNGTKNGIRGNEQCVLRTVVSDIGI